MSKWVVASQRRMPENRLYREPVTYNTWGRELEGVWT